MEWEKELEGGKFENFLFEIKARYGKQILCAKGKQRNSYTASHGHAGVTPSLGRQTPLTLCPLHFSPSFCF